MGVDRGQIGGFPELIPSPPLVFEEDIRSAISWQIGAADRVAKSDLNSTNAYFATKNQHQKMAQKWPKIAQKCPKIDEMAQKLTR